MGTHCGIYNILVTMAQVLPLATPMVVVVGAISGYLSLSSAFTRKTH